MQLVFSLCTVENDCIWKKSLNDLLLKVALLKLEAEIREWWGKGMVED